MPTLQEIKEKLPTVKLPTELKKDASFIGNTALFFASPAIYAAKENSKENDKQDWYVKSRNAVIGSLVAGVVSIVASNIIDDIRLAFRNKTISRQEVAYDSGKVVYTHKNDFRVKDGILMRMFLPFERQFMEGTYEVADRWTSFEGKFKRNGLDFKIEGNMPFTTNVTAITKEDLYRYTRHTKVEDTTLAAEYALDLKEKY